MPVQAPKPSIKKGKYITQNTLFSMSVLKMGLTGLNAQGLSAKAQNLVDDMTGNANFATPEPALADITAKREELDTWINKSSFGDTRAIENRNLVASEMKVMLRALAGYVSSIARGEGTVIISSGFKLRNENSPAPKLDQLADLSVNRTAYSGRVKLNWAGVKGSHTYVVEMTTRNPELEEGWNTIAMTTKSKLEVSNLEFGNYYYFRVKAVGTAGESPVSEVAFIRAA